MPTLAQQMMVTLLVGVLMGGLSAATPLSVSTSDGTTPQGLELFMTPQGICLRVMSQPLGDVLQHIQRASGVQFELPRGLMQGFITATIEATDWPTVIKRLLRAFSRVETWSREEQLLRVTVFESGQEQDKPPRTAVTTRTADARAETHEGKATAVSSTETGLLVELLQQLAFESINGPGLAIDPLPSDGKAQP